MANDNNNDRLKLKDAEYMRLRDRHNDASKRVITLIDDESALCRGLIYNDDVVITEDDGEI